MLKLTRTAEAMTKAGLRTTAFGQRVVFFSPRLVHYALASHRFGAFGVPHDQRVIVMQRPLFKTIDKEATNG